MKSIVETLWQIDRQHELFKERDYCIPSCFQSFNGYNVPQMSKHRKRERNNMSSSTLHTCADTVLMLTMSLLEQIWLERLQNQMLK